MKESLQLLNAFSIEELERFKTHLQHSVSDLPPDIDEFLEVFKNEYKIAQLYSSYDPNEKAEDLYAAMPLDAHFYKQDTALKIDLIDSILFIKMGSTGELGVALLDFYQAANSLYHANYDPNPSPTLDTIQAYIQKSVERKKLAEELLTPKIDALSTACAEYESYLQNVIMKSQHQIDVEDATLELVNLNGDPRDFQVASIPESLRKKNQKLLKLKEILQDDNMPNALKIHAFKEELSDNDTIDIFKSNRDSGTRLFFKTVGHILSLGIISKITKGTFQFWKPASEVLYDKLSRIINKPGHTLKK